LKGSWFFYDLFAIDRLLWYLRFLPQINREFKMAKEVVKHRKDEKKKPALSPKEKKAKKVEKKQTKKTP